MDTERKKPEITTAIILEKHVTTKEGKHPVKLRVTYQRKRKYYTLKKEHYTIDEYNNIINPGSRSNNKVKRKRFEAFEDRAIDIIDNKLISFSFEAFENLYLSNRSKFTTIESYFNEKAGELESNEKFQTATLYRATIKSLLEFDKKITFQKITPSYLQKYEKWMLSNERTYTTVGMYMRNLRYIVKKAINDNIIHDYPFGRKEDNKYPIPESNNKKKALNIIEVEKLFSYMTENRNEYLALQYWLFSYLCNGMNMVDIAKLKYKQIQNDRFTFIRQKTKDTTTKKSEIEVLLMPESIEIIKDIGNPDSKQDNYIFPIISDEMTELEKLKRVKQHIKITNKYLKRIAVKLDIDSSITTYWARHSYSTILKRSGAPIEFIREQLGHKSTDVTQSYLDSFEDEQRKKYSQSLRLSKNNIEQ